MVNRQKAKFPKKLFSGTLPTKYYYQKVFSECGKIRMRNNTAFGYFSRSELVNDWRVVKIERD